jgi:tripartite-type tricarboxylate transporter receptor subunit TctC
MNLVTRLLIQTSVALSAAAYLPVVNAQTNAQTTWPTGPVKIIVPFTAGGASDLLTRYMAERLSTKFGQNFVVENRTGAGGNIGMEAVRNAPPDGNMISSATIGTLSINQFLFSKMPYDPAKDFEYSSMIWENCNVLVVSANHPSKTAQEFLAWAKAQPKGVTFGSAGVGTTPHLAGELFGVRNSLKVIHVPFRGAAQSMPALIAGDTDFAIDNIASYMPHIKAGKVKALAVTASDRWATLPEVPTMAQVGVKDFIITSWGAFVLPKGTPVAIITKLSDAVKEIAADPAMQKRFLDSGARTVYTAPQETFAFAERERVKWKAMVEISGAKLD